MLENQLILPFNLAYALPENAPVRLFADLIEHLSMREFHEYQNSVGRPPFPAKILVRIILFAHMLGISSSRAIEELCLYDLRFRWLLEGYKAPEHSTISRFMSSDRLELFEDYFYQLIHLLFERGEIRLENFFVDGTKLEAVSNRYSFVWKKSIQKHLGRLKEKALAFIRKLVDEGYFLGSYDEQTLSLPVLEKAYGLLDEVAKETRLEFVSGKGSRKTSLQRLIEEASQMIEKWYEYLTHLEILGDRNSYSKTDHEATFMRMKQDHMRNGQLKPGYNIQFAVEAGYVVGVLVNQQRTDQLTLVPLLEKLEKYLKTYPQKLITDSGYESEYNYSKLDEWGIDAYITPLVHEQMKKAKFKNHIGKRENMTYILEGDYYLCHQKRKLSFTHTSIRKHISGYEVQVKNYKCETCSGCPVKPKCTRAEGDRSLSVSEKFDAYRKASSGRITSQEGVILRVNRSIQAEGAFAVLKDQLKLRRMTRRGLSGSQLQVLFFSLAMNLNKYISKALSGTSGQQLFFSRAA